MQNPRAPKLAACGGLCLCVRFVSPWPGAAAFLGLLHGGPELQAPALPAPPAYKELPPPNSPQASEWAPAQPNDAIARGKWWEIYNDPELNALEEQVSISNQNVIAAEAQFREAKFAVRDCALQPVPDDFRRSFHCERANVGYRRPAVLKTSSSARTTYDLPVDVS